MDEGEEQRRRRTDGYNLPAAFREGDSEANRQEATQSYKRIRV